MVGANRLPIDKTRDIENCRRFAIFHAYLSVLLVNVNNLYMMKHILVFNSSTSGTPLKRHIYSHNKWLG